MNELDTPKGRTLHGVEAQASQSFVVSTGDRITLEGFVANFTASRQYVGSTTSAQICMMELEVLD